MKDQQASYPQLRFKGFTDPWEKRKLGELNDVRDGTHDSPKYVVNGHPFVTSKNLSDQGLDLSDISYISDEDFAAFNKRSKVDVGDILFGMIGTIGHPVLVESDSFAIKNVALIKGGGKISNCYLLQLLKSPVFDRYVKRENAGGTHKFLGLNLVRDFVLRVPNDDEQRKIGTFFAYLDNLIAVNQRKLAKLKELKQGYLQKLFPENGSKFPQLRFAGFADAWEKRKLGELANIRRGASPRPIKSKKWFSQTSQVGWIRISDVTEQNGRIHQVEQHLSDAGQKKTLVLKSKHLLLSIAATVGKPVQNYIQVGVHDGFIVFMDPKFDLDFMFYFLEKYRPNWARFGQPGSQININSELVRDLVVSIPTVHEQDAVAQFIITLDNLIAATQCKLDLLKKLKKGYLQKMFC